MLKKRLVNFFILMAALVLISSMLRQIGQLYKAGKKIDDAHTRLESLKAENLNLQNELKLVQNQEFVEKEAKNRLNYVREGEVVVVLPKQENGLVSEQNKPKKEPSNWQKWWQAVF